MPTGIDWQWYADKSPNTPVVFVEAAWGSGTGYYATSHVRTEDRLWKGNIISVPTIPNSVGDIERTYERACATVIFSDTDFEFRKLEQDPVSLRKRLVTISIAFAEDNFGSPNSLVIFTGRVRSWERMPNLQFRIVVEQTTKNFKNEFPVKRVEVGDYPYCGGSEGALIPIPFGEISNWEFNSEGVVVPGAWPTFCVNSKELSQNTDFLVGIQSAAITVDRVYATHITGGVTMILDPQYYTIVSNEIDGFIHTIIRIDIVNYDMVEIISCDIRYIPDAENPGPVNQIIPFLIGFGGHVEEDFDMDSVDAATLQENIRGYKLSGGIMEPTSIQALLDTWRNEYELDTYWDKAGLIHFRYTGGTIDVENARWVDGPTQVLSRVSSLPDLDNLWNKVVCTYKYDYNKKMFRGAVYDEDEASQTKYGGTFQLVKEFFWVRDADPMADIASRILTRFKDPLSLVNLTMPLPYYSLELAEIFFLTHEDGEGFSGYDETPMQVRSFNMNPDNFTVDIVAEDVTRYLTGPS